jgi:hypothetical protein
MSIRNLRVNPKDYKLNCSEDIMKNLKPYFEVSSRCISLTHAEKEMSQGTSKKTSGHEGKCIIDVKLRDSVTGDMLGKGHVEYDENAKKPDKYEEKVELKDVWGNKVGEAVLEVEQKKMQQGGIEEDFRKMRREIGHMMRETNRIFDNFSRRYSGRDYGFGLLDDFRPMLMFDEPWMRDEMKGLGYGGGSQDQGKIDVEQPKSTGSTMSGQTSTGTSMSGGMGSQSKGTSKEQMGTQSGTMGSPSHQKMQGGDKMQMEGKQGMQQGMKEGMKGTDKNRFEVETEKPSKA